MNYYNGQTNLMLKMNNEHKLLYHFLFMHDNLTGKQKGFAIYFHWKTTWGRVNQVREEEMKTTILLIISFFLFR